KLVTIDVNPKSKRYGKVISKVSTGARVEAHHMGFTDDRRYLWAGGLSDNRIWVFDVGRNPAAPKLARTISDLGEKSGFLGPHTYYALPGRMLVQALSNTQDKGGRTGMALYNNKGEFITSYSMPSEGGGDGYGYDLAVNPRQNALLTSSFTGYANYMRPLGELIKDAEAMKKFGSSMVLWNLKTMKPAKVFAVPGAPLEIRWSLNPKQNYGKVTGKQIDMISQSWDGKLLYITSSLLANWDKGGADNEQFLRGFAWDGSELARKFEVDFTKEKLGRAHHMKLGTKAQR